MPKKVLGVRLLPTLIKILLWTVVTLIDFYYSHEGKCEIPFFKS